MDCCGSPSYERVFTSRMARWAAARYAWKGLGWGPRRMLELYETRMVSGNSLLEVGGGIGDLQVELVKAGVDRVVSVEISPSYEEAASRLARGAGVEDRVTRIIGDFVAVSGQVDPCDLVVMHSVVCCYPDMERLVAAAAEKTNRFLVMSYPPDTWWLRLGATIQNRWYEHVRKSEYRFFVHPPDQIHMAAAEAGLVLIHQEGRFGDLLSVFERMSPQKGM